MARWLSCPPIPSGGAFLRGRVGGAKSIPNETGANMNKSLLTIAALFIATLPYAARAQGTIRGAEEGAAAGDRAAGPIGGIVGGAVGAATGTVGGILGVEERPRFREHVIHEHRGHSYRYNQDPRIGMILPERGLVLYPVPPEYRVDPRYRYAYVNDQVVIVDPRTHRVV